MDKEIDPSGLELTRQAIKSLQSLVTDRNPAAEPPAELAVIEGFADLYDSLCELRTALLAISAGDLEIPLKMKGYLPGALKGLQAALRHLTWQTKAIASGDFSQKVDFMGDFSAAFNSMVQQLDETMQKLHAREQELETLAHTDPLTGCNNRGYFLELLGLEVARSRRYGNKFAVLVLDIDHFKLVNDTLGHAAGDEALRSFRRVLKETGLRQSDFLGRLGGEEFALALPETDLQQAGAVAERIRAAVAEAPIEYEGRHFMITTSIGASAYRPGDSQESVLRRADEAMYRAKNSGRNKVCLEV